MWTKETPDWPLERETRPFFILSFILTQNYPNTSNAWLCLILYLTWQKPNPETADHESDAAASEAEEDQETSQTTSDDFAVDVEAAFSAEAVASMDAEVELERQAAEEQAQRKLANNASVAGIGTSALTDEVVEVESGSSLSHWALWRQSDRSLGKFLKE